MTIAIDFNAPLTTDNYSTGFVPKLQANIQALGMLLDSALVTYANTPNGTKRFNSTSGLFEQWNGSAWAALSTGYLLDAGDTLTGTLITNNNIAHRWKDSGGTARDILYVDGSNNVRVGDAGNAMVGGQVLMNANSSIVFTINGATMWTLASTGMTVASGVISTAASESMRQRSDTGFLSFYNTAGTTRTGYLQGNTGASLKLMAENGAALQLGTAGAVAVYVDTSQNVGVGSTPSAWGSGTKAIQMPTYGSLYDVNSGVSGLASNAYYDGANWRYRTTNYAGVIQQSAGGGMGVFVAPSGTAGSAITFVQALNLSAAGQLTITNSSGICAQFDSTAASGGYTQYSNSGTVYGYVGAGSQLVTGGASSDMAIRVASGSILFSVGATEVGRLTSAGMRLSVCATTTPNKPAAASGAITLDCSKSNVFEQTLNGNATSLTLNNLLDGQTVNIFFTQDATGSRTLSGLTSANGYLWPGGAAGVLSTAAGAVDLLVCTYRSTTGKVHCTLTKAFA